MPFGANINCDRNLGEISRIVENKSFDSCKLLFFLFACEQSNVTPDGSPTYLEFKQEQLEKMFGK